MHKFVLKVKCFLPWSVSYHFLCDHSLNVYLSPVSIKRYTRMLFCPFSRSPNLAKSSGSHWLLLLSKPVRRKRGAEPSCNVHVHERTQPCSRVSLQMRLHRKQLPVVAHREEQSLRVPAWDQKRRCRAALCNTTEQVSIQCFYFKGKKKLYNLFNLKVELETILLLKARFQLLSVL